MKSIYLYTAGKGLSHIMCLKLHWVCTDIRGGLFTQVNVEVQVQVTNQLLLLIHKLVAITDL